MASSSEDGGAVAAADARAEWPLVNLIPATQRTEQNYRAIREETERVTLQAYRARALSMLGKGIGADVTLYRNVRAVSKPRIMRKRQLNGSIAGR